MPELAHHPELPDRPDLDQLRRQARELLRAANAGHPEARGRLQAVSSKATLSGAQLAIAREFGFASWAKLKGEVERRRTTAVAAPGSHWSLGGAPPLELEQGVLSPGALLVEEGRAVLEGTFVPSREIPTGPPPAWQRLVMQVPVVPRLLRVRREPPLPQLRGLHATDDRGAVYAVRPRSASGMSRRSRRTQVLDVMHVVLSVDPAPPRAVEWVELCDEAGAISRLLPARQASVVVGETGVSTSTAGPGFGGLIPFDVDAELQFSDGVSVSVECLVPGEDAWRLHLRVQPGWWRTREEVEGRVPVLDVVAEDDLGGTYTSRLGGIRRRREGEDDTSQPGKVRRERDWQAVALDFRPRLDPGVRRLTMRFFVADQQINMRVEPRA